MDLQDELRQWSRDGTADFQKTFGVMPGRWLQLEAQYGTLFTEDERAVARARLQQFNYKE